MKQSFILFLSIFFGFIEFIFAQTGTPVQKATLITKASFMIKVPSIAAQIANGEFKPAVDSDKEVNPKHRDANQAVPGKGLPKGTDPLWLQQSKVSKIKGKDPILTFQAASSNSTPTDPTGAVGPDHFVNAWNSSFRIWDKQGNPLTPAASLSTIFPGETAGDPIVMYDQIADRFVVTEFTFLNGFLVAVSQGSDPVNSGWYTYFFQTNSFPDYPKFSLWSDGYYITANKNSGSAGFSEVVFAIERDEMLVGNPDAQMLGFPLPTIVTSGFYSPLGFNVCGFEMPPPGNAPIVYMQDDVWNGVNTDHLKIWTINVDWANPGNSDISNPQILNTIPFDGLFDGGSFSNLPQPSGQDIDALQATIMYMAQYRRFSDHNSVVFNFVVDLTGADDYAGIRWYELRQTNDGDPWAIFQEGTYSQPDGHSAFSGTMCMDNQGNIALSYTIVSNSHYPSLRYTGRYSTDPLNVMTIEEESFAEGTVSDPSNRYGDYSQMTVDPVDDQTFWAIGEYFNGGPRKDQAVVFKLASELANDVGIVSIDEPVNGILTNDEPVTITIRNYGVDAQVSIPVSYQINEGTVVTENYTGNLPSNTDVQYTFSTTGDFSVPGTAYLIKASSILPGDQFTENDTLSKLVTHLFADDIGVSEIIEPVSGTYLTDSEPVKVTITNFGALTQTDFDITFILDNNIPVTEQVGELLTMESSLEFTFNATADLSAIGYHELKVTTSLPGDANTTNDTASATIINSLCQPDMMCEQGVGIFVFELENISNNSGCDPNGYGNYTNLTADLNQGTTHNLTITTGYGSVFVKVWIDFNDNFIFEESEITVNDYEIAPGQTAGTYTETMPLVIPVDAMLGEHLMRAKTNYNGSVPSDPCEATLFGEAEDYIAAISPTTGFDIQSKDVRELLLIDRGNNRFELRFYTEVFREPMIVSVHNIKGQKVIQNHVQQVNGLYTYIFDMSYAPKGVYLLRIGTETFGKVKRFMVQ
jgi:hypothetical protein